MFGSTIVPLVLATSALANVFMTSPVSSTTMNAGQQATVTWQDDGNSPSLAQFGLASFGIYAGNAIEQTLLQTIATSVNVSATSSVTFTPDGTIGPNGKTYFVRATSMSYMTSTTPSYPAEAFSAMFTMAGMSGTFNSSVQAEINGQSTAPIGGTTSMSGASMTTGMTSTTTKPASSASTTPASTSVSTSSPATSSAKTTSTTSGAGKPVIATGFVALVAALVGASLL